MNQPRTDAGPDRHNEVAVAFRGAMRRLAATVNVVTTVSSEDAPFGMAATSVTPLAMEPPSLLVCINSSSRFHALLLERKAFCVNILASGHRTQCVAFGSASGWDRRFEEGDWQRGPDRLPYLADAQANIFCDLVCRHAFGTHDICIGIVRAVRTTEQIGPLLYVDGDFATLASKRP